jgi:anti-anti-sigma factor
VDIETRTVGQVEIVEFIGNVSLGDGRDKMRAHFRSSLDGGQRQFLFNVRKVDYMDSAAIAETVACFKRAREAGGEVKILLEQGSRIDDLMRLTGLNNVLDVFSDESEALASFG